MSLAVLRRYLDALSARDFEALGATLAEDVHRTGPYLDVVEGRDAYRSFLEKVVSGLANYELRIDRIRGLEGGGALVELSETLDQDGVRRTFPEALVFEFGPEGLIARVDVFLKQPPRRA